jgi:hypothetical protein
MLGSSISAWVAGLWKNPGEPEAGIKPRLHKDFLADMLLSSFGMARALR